MRGNLKIAAMAEGVGHVPFKTATVRGSAKCNHTIFSGGDRECYGDQREACVVAFRRCAVADWRNTSKILSDDFQCNHL
jgi:hypothetical protein